MTFQSAPIRAGWGFFADGDFVRRVLEDANGCINVFVQEPGMALDLDHNRRPPFPVLIVAPGQIDHLFTEVAE